MNKTIANAAFTALSTLWFMVALAMLFCVPETFTFTLVIAKLLMVGAGIAMLRVWYKAYRFLAIKRIIDRIA